VALCAEIDRAAAGLDHAYADQFRRGLWRVLGCASPLAYAWLPPVRKKGETLQAFVTRHVAKLMAAGATDGYVPVDPMPAIGEALLGHVHDATSDATTHFGLRHIMELFASHHASASIHDAAERTNATLQLARHLRSTSQNVEFRRSGSRRYTIHLGALSPFGAP
jgi:hypothetical protein